MLEKQDKTPPDPNSTTPIQTQGETQTNSPKVKIHPSQRPVFTLYLFKPIKDTHLNKDLEYLKQSTKNLAKRIENLEYQSVKDKIKEIHKSHIIYSILAGTLSNIIITYFFDPILPKILTSTYEGQFAKYGAFLICFYILLKDTHDKVRDSLKTREYVVEDKLTEIFSEIKKNDPLRSLNNKEQLNNFYKVLIFLLSNHIDDLSKILPQELSPINVESNPQDFHNLLEIKGVNNRTSNLVTPYLMLLNFLKIEGNSFIIDCILDIHKYYQDTPSYQEAISILEILNSCLTDNLLEKKNLPNSLLYDINQQKKIFNYHCLEKDSALYKFFIFHSKIENFFEKSIYLFLVRDLLDILTNTPFSTNIYNKWDMPGGSNLRKDFVPRTI